MTNVQVAAAGEGGFKIIGEAVTDLAGTSVAAIGDLNFDGLPEVLVGASGNVAGASYVVFGKADGGQVDLGKVADGVGGFKMLGDRGDRRGDLAGSSVAAVDDLNGDLRDEILVGAVGSEAHQELVGAVYVVFSQADWIGA